MQITCKHCGAKIPSADIDINQLMPKCPKCNAVFSIAQLVDGKSAHSPERLETPMSRGLAVESGMGNLKITRTWLTPSIFGLTCFCLFWNGLLAVWYWVTLTHRWWGMTIFVTIHALIGLAVAYIVLSNYINKTFIEVDSRGVEIHHGPLPPFGRKRLESTEIKQLYTKEGLSDRRSGTTIYEVRAVTYGDRDEIVVFGLPDPSQALYIEQEIERALGIKDRPVPEELPR